MPDNDRLPRSVVDFASRLRRAHANERRRLARELHDQVGNALGVALNSLELHECYLERDPPRAQTQLRHAVRAVRRALERVHALSSDLRSREVHDGLEHALSDYLLMAAPPTVRWVVRVSGDDSELPVDMRDELYLILCEAARNSLIHASARNIEVLVEIGSDVVRAAVSDDGCGFNLGRYPSAGGLASMRERAQLLGGSMKLSSKPNAGTVVHVHVPRHIVAG